MADQEEELDLNVTTDDVEVEKEEEGDDTAPLVVKMSDDLIAVVRELVQLSILTGTNVVDHFRAITCEIDEDTNKLVPTEEYVEAYNTMVESLVKKAEAARATLEEAEGITKEDLAAGNFTASLVSSGDGDLN